MSSELETCGQKNVKEIALPLANELLSLRNSNTKNSQRRHQKYASNIIKTKSSTESSLEESLEVLKLQVNSLGLFAVNEVDVFTELVPPPPESTAAAAAASSESNVRKEFYSSSEIAIAPPPEFSDNSPQFRNRSSSHRTASKIHQNKTTH
ncbi:SH3 and multiple ankyrin repeat domains protein 1 [Trichonephila clavipes]|nr:SH3 and multiple ankyrin repeat domains protein 1 [Trichonephila clavipes]